MNDAIMTDGKEYVKYFSDGDYYLINTDESMCCFQIRKTGSFDC
jgi:hypothetical protein